jgi:hypothetical protein
MLKRTLWFGFLMMLALSCLDEPDCFSLNNNEIGIVFKKLSASKADTVYFSSITADGTGYKFGENVLLTGIDTLSLNYYQNETTFHFNGLDRTFDLHLTYSAKAQLVSEECGERFVLTGLKVASHNFDSLRLLSSTPKRSNSTGTHIEIYRCPNTSRVKLKFKDAVKFQSISTDYNAAILYNTEDDFTTINIPLNVNASTSTITFQINGVTKSITLGYSATQRTLFNVCGEQTILYGYEVMSTTLGSVNPLYDSIQDPPKTNFEITF